jgi:hypothetical protein
MSIFCDCAKCGSSICEGNQCYSITLSKDFVESEITIQPLEATSIVVWCIDCGPNAVKELAHFTKSANSSCNPTFPGI